MYHRQVLFFIVFLFISVASVVGNVTLFDCISTLNQSACSAKGEFLEFNKTVSSCPRCRGGLGM